MNTIAFVIVALVLGWTAFKICNFCTFCGVRLKPSDRMPTGRIRYRKAGTNLPSCRTCAFHRPREVE